MGKYIHQRIKEVVHESSLIQKFGGYENSASLSFMEGESTPGMIWKYGRYRLEFNLKGIVTLGPITGGFMNCEYVPESALEEYADEYCELLKQKWMSIPILQEKYGKTSIYALCAITDFLMMETDIMYKVFTIKEERWSEEKEWRQVLQIKDGDTDVFYTNDGRPYKKFYIPKEALTGISILMEDSSDEYKNTKIELQSFMKLKGYNVPVKVEKVF